MLGENHALLNEFPKLREKILELVENDAEFKQKMLRYNGLDEEIRNLELANSPIDDAQMHEKKVQRATLKDELYQRALERV